MKELNNLEHNSDGSNEKLHLSDVSDSDLFQEDSESLMIEDSESLMIEVIDKIKPFYQKYGLENTIYFLESILNGIHDVGGEYFGE